MSQNQIKWLAAILMIVDHIGFLLEIEPMRIIGRLSFPLFAWVLAQNWKRRKPESNAKPLITRLLVFGIISQIPYILLFNRVEFNILISFAVAVITFTQIHKAPTNKKILVMILGTVTAQLLGVNYGWYAVACPVLMINLKGTGDRIWWGSWIVTNMVYAATSNYFFQISAILAPLILAWHKAAKDQKPTAIEKKFFYYFYPIHLASLAALKTIM
ncbi:MULTISPECIES: TraX family protein [unclassified Microcoleus]|uniref:TraX family protein n=1 Tax=unclassified Microcoleus TaxID=2642155 RepID=UPI002FD1D764